MTSTAQIALATHVDVDRIAAVHAACFERQQRSADWIGCKLAAFPAVRVFAAWLNGQVVGYSTWCEKSGFRERVVLELEQIGVLPTWRGKGIATVLLSESLLAVRSAIAERGAEADTIMATTRSDNDAQRRLYRRTLGAEVAASIPQLFGAADEVVMLAHLLPRTT